MGETNKKTDNDFSLYTEKIVEQPAVKYKNLIHFLKIIGGALFFGVITSFVVALAYPHINSIFDISGDERESLAIVKDEYPMDDVKSTEAESDAAGSKVTDSDNGRSNVITVEDYNAFIKTLESTVAVIKKSTVIVDSSHSNVDDFLNEEGNKTGAIGIVIGQVNQEYVIMTNSDVITEEDPIVVKVSASTEVNANLIGKNDTVGIALVAVKESSIPAGERSQIVIAKLGNSYNAKQGDMVIAAGRLYGKIGSVDYGTIASITSTSGLDNAYELMETGLSYMTKDFSYLFNTAGEVIGISKDKGKDTLVAVGVSDLKSMIENLSAGKGAAYIGIKGQNITGTMATMHGLPMGIYVSEVEIDSPAYEAGIQSGDVITAIDENMVLTIQAFSEKLYQCDNGQLIKITAKRRGKDGYSEVEFVAGVQFQN